MHPDPTKGIFTLAGDGSMNLEDIGKVIKHSMEIAEEASDMTGAEKKDFAANLSSKLSKQLLKSIQPKLDKWVEELDLPGPEWLEKAMWDPMLKAAVPSLVPVILDRVVPSVIDLVVDATKGKLFINKAD